MEKKEIITIKEVIDTNTGKVRSSALLLEEFNRTPETKNKARKDVLDAISSGTPLYVCASCHEPVRLNGGHPGEGKRMLYFKHNDKHDGCIYTDFPGLSEEEINTIKFHGLEEGETHLRLKEFIADTLKQEGYEVRVEKRIFLIKDMGEIPYKKTKRFWRQPDVRAYNDTRDLIFEIQLATTSINVIKARMDFYRDHRKHILWVVDEIDQSNDDIQFTQADILAYTNRNIYQLDKDMMKLSREKEKLHFKCWCREPYLDESDEICFKWAYEVVTLDDLHYDDYNYIAYRYNSESEERKLIEKRNRLQTEKRSDVEKSQRNSDSSDIEYTDLTLNLDKVWDMTSDLSSFIGILKRFDTEEISNQSGDYIEKVKSFKDSYTINEDYAIAEIERLMYLSFIYRLNCSSVSEGTMISLRNRLDDVSNVRFLIMLASYPLGQVIGAQFSNLSELTCYLCRSYAGYPHIVMVMIRKYGLQGELLSEYNELDRAKRCVILSFYLEDLVAVVFRGVTHEELKGVRLGI